MSSERNFQAVHQHGGEETGQAEVERGAQVLAGENDAEAKNLEPDREMRQVRKPRGFVEKLVLRLGRETFAKAELRPAD